MSGISYVMSARFTTIILSLPTAGLFREQLAAVKDARQAYLKGGNIEAVQVLQIVIAAMERGIIAFDYETEPSIYPGVLP